MSDNPWLHIALAQEMGSATLRPLLNHFGTAAAIVGSSQRKLIAAGLPSEVARSLLQPDAGRLQSLKGWLESGEHHLLHWEDPRYPRLLLECPQNPAVLFVAGSPASLTLLQLAIVGSRNATASGLANAREFAADLATAGLTITSGLAAGVDAAAHAGALDAGGTSIAVLGTGPDIVYPEANARLANRIRHAGALVSEFPPGMPVRRGHFPRRNRIISGLSLGVLVIEAGIRSGSLITARHSGDFGREVFAVPGSIHSPLSKGCHRLIKQGAKLVENSADILEELHALTDAFQAVHISQPSRAEPAAHADPDYAKLLCSMGHEPVDIQTLAAGSGLTTAELSSMLLILELEGQVESLPGGRFQKSLGGTH